MTNPDPFNEFFTAAIDGRPLPSGRCEHALVRAYHVTRYVPGTVTVCKACNTPLKFTPDVVRERVVFEQRVKRQYVDRPVELGAAEWGLVFFVGVIFFCLGMVVGGL